MGAKESRIGFLSYEEALRRGEGEGSGELRGGQCRAPEGGWPEGGAAGSAGAWGVWRGTWGGAGVGILRAGRWSGERCLGIGALGEGAKLSQ